MDVFETEPLPADSRFWEIGPLIVSPHCSSVHAKREAASFDLLLRNPADGTNAEDLIHIVDPSRGYRRPQPREPQPRTALLRFAALRAVCSICLYGLRADLGCGAASARGQTGGHVRTAHCCLSPCLRVSATAARFAVIRCGRKIWSGSNSHNAGLSGLVQSPLLLMQHFLAFAACVVL